MKKVIKKNIKSRGSLADIRKDNLHQILTSAEQVFAERGYRGTTVAAIAEAVGLPKANILYYFKTKEGLYKAVINQLLTLWMNHMNEMSADSHPNEALPKYISNKIRQSKEHPNASRIFAAEVLHGAHYLRDSLQEELKDQFDQTCQVFDAWVEKEWMDPINSEHLLFMLWSTTQAYADHGLQISILMGKEHLDEDDFEKGIKLLTQVTLKGCGIKPL
ncbi:TetR/AcrR family transcriptional regulator [uncultured Psychromonas sp.]|uniref:TetR/AcrR family transcriptional regulator n=1 Tax=uncultured Psychromonas sp. TaxID=173974 RepID=UPI002636F3B1|nr:TetR/AcrR family transcriptional regulator [uncultured Psychromonas sp.]